MPYTWKEGRHHAAPVERDVLTTAGLPVDLTAIWWKGYIIWAEGVSIDSKAGLGGYKGKIQGRAMRPNGVMLPPTRKVRYDKRSEAWQLAVAKVEDDVLHGLSLTTERPWLQDEHENQLA